MMHGNGRLCRENFELKHFDIYSDRWGYVNVK